MKDSKLEFILKELIAIFKMQSDRNKEQLAFNKGTLILLKAIDIRLKKLEKGGES